MPECRFLSICYVRCSQLLDDFQLFLIQTFFSMTLFFLSVLHSSYTNIRSFIVILQVPEALFFLSPSVFSFCYLVELVCLSVFKFTASSIVLWHSLCDFLVLGILLYSSKISI